MDSTSKLEQEFEKYVFAIPRKEFRKLLALPRDLNYKWHINVICDQLIHRHLK